MRVLEYIWIAFLGLLVLGLLASFPDLLKALKFALGPWKRPPTPPKIGIVSQAFVPAPGLRVSAGKIRFDGAIWNAECETSEASELRVGDTVKVESMDGLTAKISKQVGTAV